jgi:hypothetical protein
MPEHDGLLRDLNELGRSVPTPGAPGMEEAVMARLPETATAPTRRPGTLLRVVAVVLTSLLALLLVPPVRAQISDWFGFGSVVVRQDDGASPPTGPVSPPPDGGMSLDEAAARVDFAVFELPALGPPRGAEVVLDRRVVSLGWDGGIRLDQSSSIRFTFDKTVTSVSHVSVDGREALWFADAHEVVLLDENGVAIPETGRPAGRTLVWTIGDTTLRLEGDLNLEQAVELAESARSYR